MPISVSGFVSFPQSSDRNHDCISNTTGGSAASEASSGRLSLRLSAHNPLGIASSGSGGSCGAAENVVVHIPLPSFVASATLTATTGTIRHIISKQVSLYKSKLNMHSRLSPLRYRARKLEAPMRFLVFLDDFVGSAVLGI